MIKSAGLYLKTGKRSIQRDSRGSNPTSGNNSLALKANQVESDAKDGHDQGSCGPSHLLPQPVHHCCQPRNSQHITQPLLQQCSPHGQATEILALQPQKVDFLQHDEKI